MSSEHIWAYHVTDNTVMVYIMENMNPVFRIYNIIDGSEYVIFCVRIIICTNEFAHCRHGISFCDHAAHQHKKMKRQY